jgi:hypothetical protein
MSTENEGQMPDQMPDWIRELGEVAARRNLDKQRDDFLAIHDKYEALKAAFPQPVKSWLGEQIGWHKNGVVTDMFGNQLNGPFDRR